MNAGLKQRVKERQGYHCYVCGGQGDDLHHIIHKSQAPELRDYIDNLVFVCRECHNKIHHTPQLDKKLKREYKKHIEQKFLHEKYYTIKEIAEITHMEEDFIEKCIVKRLIKNFAIVEKQVKVKGIDIIRWLLGGKL
ncbi:HNH endonuclease [Caloramator sp. Dgby_cultured_2]|uniref:HNH endonuclease n=1 Tax=Caloramator sp. Dgby_cultured_2 TaxID=3029174 RepID=UPI00237E2E25|nr:HNH endonuclease signature motif containing protein [Caloramator sp. Dgby_cultured_2]WDU84225.1 HNH endonuclease signature motif containing protein [Caloramator sp. Dgby_cultured_2]